MAGLLLALLLGLAETPNLAWLEGDWCTEAAQGRQTCEHWGPTRGGTMLGTSQTLRDGQSRDFEFMRIEFSVGVALFHASPRGGPAVLFRETAREATGITFANPGHDYPQRVRYWRRGAELVAEIALADGTKPRRWVYHRRR